jgi:molecular chaperone DnaK
MTEPSLVVDFGTCFSSAATVTGQDVHLVNEPASGSLAWSSAVFLDGEKLLVGTLAENRKRRDPAAYRTEFKRDLGQAEGIVLGDRSFAPQELVTAVLMALKREAERIAGSTITRGVITVPASYTFADQRRALMIAAAEAAGLRTVELLAEPVAAVFAPVLGTPLRPGELVLVYDFGGGTFDTALVRIGEPAHEILGNAALDDCGGRDVDALLAAQLEAEADQWLTSLLGAPTPAEEKAAALRLHMALGDVARNMKHQLSETTEAEDFLIPTAPASRLSRAELAALATPMVRRTVNCCRDLIRRLDVSTADISAVLLVGGTTRMPIVAEILGREIGRPLRQTDDPDLAVVRGAAQWAMSNAVRQIPPLPHAPGTALLSWEAPHGRLLRWLVPIGAPYEAGTPLVRVRLDDGSLWDLAASVAGRLDQVLAAPGSEYDPGQCLAVAAQAKTESGA